MDDATLQSLIAAARRRIWRGEFVAAARWASWGTIAVTLLAVAVHLALRPVGVGIVAAAVAVLWASLLAAAGGRRPADAACALWADRHAGGASAYSTWLEMRAGPSTAAQTPAFAWLEQWARAKAPESLRLLAEKRDPLHLARPLLAVIVCAAFAAVVLTLPGLAPSARPAASTSPNVAEPATTTETAPAAAGQLVGDLASALRAAESRRAADGRPLDSSKTGGAGILDPTTERTMAPAPSLPGAERPPSPQSALGSADAAAPAPGAAASSSAGSGRGAGESADTRAETGSSRAARGTMPLQMRESTAARPSPSLEADASEPATFDEDSRAPQAASVRADRAPPAALPPATPETAHLTATQAAYVQAWMKAIGPRQ